MKAYINDTRQVVRTWQEFSRLTLREWHNERASRIQLADEKLDLTGLSARDIAQWIERTWQDKAWRYHV